MRTDDPKGHLRSTSTNAAKQAHYLSFLPLFHQLVWFVLPEHASFDHLAMACGVLRSSAYSGRLYEFGQHRNVANYDGNIIYFTR